jgi:hypothetical protein
MAAFHVSVAGYPEMDESRYAKQVTSKLRIDFILVVEGSVARNLRNFPRDETILYRE